MNERAPDGLMWLCIHCGKTSVDRYGIEQPHDHGWDESCMLNAVLVKKDAYGMWNVVDDPYSVQSKF
jgi:hypothetical protein